MFRLTLILHENIYNNTKQQRKFFVYMFNHFHYNFCGPSLSTTRARPECDQSESVKTGCTTVSTKIYINICVARSISRIDKSSCCCTHTVWNARKNREKIWIRPNATTMGHWWWWWWHLSNSHVSTEKKKTIRRQQREWSERKRDKSSEMHI